MVTGGFQGMAEFKAGIRWWAKQLAVGVEEGLQEAAKFILKKSREIAPIETGDLIAESKTIPQLNGLETVVWVVYGPLGSVSNSYAVTQHEFYEKKRTPGRQWKYLESPARNTNNHKKAAIIMQKKIKEKMSL